MAVQASDYLSVAGVVNFQGALTNVEGIYFQAAYIAPVAGTVGNAAGDLTISGSALANLPSALSLRGTGLLTVNLIPGDTFNGTSYVFESGSAVTVKVNGSSANDTIVGTSGADTINGGAGDDTITISGTDTVSGGVGNDVFRGTTAGLSNATITDFSVGDKIVITDATLAGFNLAVTGNTVNYTGGSLILGSIPSGHIVAQSAVGGGVQLMVVQGPAQNDFNGDGRSDILWRDSGGTIFNFLGTANGGVVNNGNNSAVTLTADWHVAGTGDFDGDGRVYILCAKRQRLHIQLPEHGQRRLLEQSGVLRYFA